MTHLVKEVVAMHNESQPLTTFHFGGDEVAHGAWIQSPSCKQLAQKLGLNASGSHFASELMDHFVQVSILYLLD